MKRRHFVLGGLMILAPLPVLADGGHDPRTLRIEAQLRAQGFHHIEVGHTWLGRVRITARSATQARELIFNPRTGEILRDYVRPLTARDGGNEGGGESPQILAPEADTGTRGDGDAGGHGDRNGD